jgi:hypothetical protein
MQEKRDYASPGYCTAGAVARGSPTPLARFGLDSNPTPLEVLAVAPFQLVRVFVVDPFGQWDRALALAAPLRAVLAGGGPQARRLRCPGILRHQLFLQRCAGEQHTEHLLCGTKTGFFWRGGLANALPPKILNSR